MIDEFAEKAKSEEVFHQAVGKLATRF